MASEKTSNIGLNKWVPTDYVKMDEFNENFDKIDEVAADHAAQLAEYAAQHGYVVIPKILADGTLDDQTDEIQYYIDKIASSPMQTGIVYLNGKDYKVSASLAPKSGVMFAGAGMHFTTIHGYGNDFSVFANSGTHDNPLLDIILKDFKIDCSNMGITGSENGGYNPNAKGIFLSYVKHLKALGLYVYNAPATGFGTDFLIKSLINGCIVENAGRLFVDGGVGSNGIGIGTGWADEEESLIISDCYAIGCGNNGIMFENQDNNYGMTSKYAGRSIVANCQSLGNGVSGFRDSGNTNISFVNNIAKGNAKDGFYFSNGVDNANSDFTAKEAMIANNQSLNNGRYGIRFLYANPEGGFIVNSNRIAENGSSGIFADVDISRSKFSDNFIYKNGANGITMNDSVINTSFNGNHIYENQNNGILIADGAKNVQIDGNKIFNNGKINDSSSDRDGVRILSVTKSISKVKVNNNMIYDEADTGLKTQRRAVAIGGNMAIDGATIMNNDVGNNQDTTTPISLALTATNSRIKQNQGDPANISIPTQPLAPDFVYQNVTNYDYTIYVPVYTTTAGNGSTISVYVGKSNPPSLLYSKRIAGDTTADTPDVLIFRVPAGAYYMVHKVGLTLGTANYIVEN